MSSDDRGLQEFRKLLQGHIQTLQGELNNLISKLPLARAQNNQEFATQVEQTKNTIKGFQDFFGAKNRPAVLDKLSSLVTRLQAHPFDHTVIRGLVQTEPELLGLSADPNQGPILEDEIKNLVNDEQLRQELAALEEKLRELIEQHDDKITHRALEEIQRLAELIRRSGKKSILETICNTESLYLTLAGLADLFTGSPRVFTTITEVATLAQKANTTARRGLDDTLLEYVDGLEIKMSDLRARLRGGKGLLSLPETASSNEEYV